jgi:hypothetical protein
MTFRFIFQEISWTPDDNSYSFVAFHIPSQVINTKYHNPNGLGSNSPPLIQRGVCESRVLKSRSERSQWLNVVFESGGFGITTNQMASKI